MRDWDIDATVEHLPVGYGDHHWAATDRRGGRWFLTLADLGAKPHCGTGVENTWRGLRAALATSAALGLGFVVAPYGELARRVGDRYALTVFAHVDGTAGDFGDTLPAARRRTVVEMLARLHGAPAPAGTPVAGPHPPTLSTLDTALGDLDRPWTGGPFAEPARELLTGSARALRALRAELDELAAATADAPRVVTHGEPHPGNLLWNGDHAHLIDWDTAGLAPPERDLWLAAPEPADLDHYARLTGHRPDPLALRLYRLRWRLDDLATFVGWFREPHDRTPDTELAWAELTGQLRTMRDD
ncbi:aminoglycoside phosphotransferase family protein [Amycolatopsis suaedae]|uniref:Aminoglycoside phosphotransferase family protein n=1 Tax=Amycolatopsis suaedae TaxID=2510978 RepID=A0A4Q7IZM7_9PSEU|nr:aminoglycoside phosphotransferase family protein [Amycolatopsis suaedae]